MFWNDPNMYGATLPYREFPFTPYREFGTVTPPFTGHTFTPWQTTPRFIPQNFYGMQPVFDPRFQDPRLLYGQWNQTPFTPVNQPLLNPFFNTQLNPFLHTQNLNIPLNYYRPYIY